MSAALACLTKTCITTLKSGAVRRSLSSGFYDEQKLYQHQVAMRRYYNTGLLFWEFLRHDIRFRSI
jgi:hypothetical protein